MRPLSVYIHTPFCKSRCYYCNFVSSIFCNEKAGEYFNKLEKEIDSFDFSSYIVKTIYFGGGTPSIVDSAFIKRVMELIKSKATVDLVEVTLECNPESFNEIKAKEYKSCGINRISFGVQSLDNNILKAIGRAHNESDFFVAYNIASKYFSNISVDLILGLPNQTEETLESDINKLLTLDKIKHISCYGLNVEKGTKLYESGYSVDEDYASFLYDFVYNKLSENEFNCYEVSNFAKDGFESKHNLVYWNRGEYKGFGVAAHSFVNNYRLENTPNIEEYIDGIDVINKIYIDPFGVESYEEYIMLGLRTKYGINLDYIKKHYNVELLKEKEKTLKKLERYITIKDNILKINKNGMYVMNSIIVELL